MSDIDEVGEIKNIPQKKIKKESILWHETIQKRIDSFDKKLQKYKMNKKSKLVE